MEEINRLVGKQIRDLRKKKGLTQEGLGWKAGLHLTYIGAVERGEKNFSIVTMSKIAEALEVPICDLLNVTPAKVEETSTAKTQKGRENQRTSKAILVKEIRKLSPEVLKLVIALIRAAEKHLPLRKD